VVLFGVVPLGFGRKIRNSVIEAMMIPAMMKNMRGLEKAGRFSGGGVGVSMVGWMQICRSLRFFSRRGEDGFLQGFCEKVMPTCGFWMVKTW
jgi:hypothetical protein